MLEVNGQTATSYWLHLSACWNLMVNGCQTSPATKRLDPIVRMMAAVSVSSSY
ncbi:hypothetical protein HanXRQr2_Chr15g0671221 [Helianthus annuus]|uniref:Uncharacterized protein n=1 Tax=Helianthus annuus TaxID=4232 RepID=A0A9K3DW56_HELAN|nr:hypothetical protein HanXRQr2_Chr15g0671221 [Helianthus annuus]KAJ0748850.1 hypothetical protein HanLR1_Chr05g0163171 [Helianthus annuus]